MSTTPVIKMEKMESSDEADNIPLLHLIKEEDEVIFGGSTTETLVGMRKRKRQEKDDLAPADEVSCFSTCTEEQEMEHFYVLHIKCENEIKLINIEKDSFNRKNILGKIAQAFQNHINYDSIKTNLGALLSAEIFTTAIRQFINSASFYLEVEKGYMCKIWSANRLTKRTIMCRPTVEDVIEKANQFSLHGEKLVLECDGTEIEDDDVLEVLLREEGTLMILQPHEIWTPVRSTKKNPLLSSSTSSTTSYIPNTRPELEISNIILSNNDQSSCSVESLLSSNKMLQDYLLDNTVLENAPSSSQQSLLRSGGDSSSSSQKTSKVHCDIFHKFEIPWHKLSSEVIQCIQRKQKLGNLFKCFVNVVVDELRQFSINIPVSVYKSVAQTAANMYPDTFLEKDGEGNVMSAVPISLVTTMRNRNNFLNRQLKIKNPGTVIMQKKQNKFAKTCVHWQQDINSENTENIEAKKEFLKSMAAKLKLEPDEKLVSKQYMMDCFGAQRTFYNNIDNVPTVQDVFHNWPMIFEQEYLYDHFEKLMDLKIANFKSNFNNSRQKLQKFFKLQGQQDDFTILHCVCEYFNENEDLIYKSYEMGTMVSDIKNNLHAITPFVSITELNSGSNDFLHNSLDFLSIPETPQTTNSSGDKYLIKFLDQAHNPNTSRLLNPIVVRTISCENLRNLNDVELNILMGAYEKNKSFKNVERVKLSKAIIRALFSQDIHITLNREDFFYITNIVCTMFETETPDLYYSCASNGQKPSGKLYDSYCNYRASLRNVGSIKRRKITTSKTATSVAESKQVVNDAFENSSEPPVTLHPETQTTDIDNKEESQNFDHFQNKIETFSAYTHSMFIKPVVTNTITRENLRDHNDVDLQILIAAHEKNKTFTNGERVKLSKTIMRRLFSEDSGIKLSRDDFLYMSSTICQTFPSETPEPYYISAMNGQKPSGKLYDAYCNYRASLRMFGVINRTTSNCASSLPESNIDGHDPLQNSSEAITFQETPTIDTGNVQHSRNFDPLQKSIETFSAYHTSMFISPMVSRTITSENLLNLNDIDLYVLKVAYGKNKTFTNSERVKLSKTIIRTLFSKDLHLKLSRDDYIYISNTICQAFPTESPELYYISSINGQKPSGKLYDSYFNCRSSLRNAGFIKSRSLNTSNSGSNVSDSNVAAEDPLVNYLESRNVIERNITDLSRYYNRLQDTSGTSTSYSSHHVHPIVRNTVSREYLRGVNDVDLSILIGVYEKNKTFRNGERVKLSKAIVRRLFSEDIHLKLTRDDYLFISNAVCQIFPTEAPETYYYINGQKPFGKLYDAFCNFRQSLRVAGVIRRRTATT